MGNPDILHPIGDIDERINVLCFDREGAETIVLTTFGCHPDVVGGNPISGDWPALYRAKLEKAMIGIPGEPFNGIGVGLREAKTSYLKAVSLN